MNEIENTYQEPEQLDPGMKMLMTDDERDPLEAVEPVGFAGLVSIIERRLKKLRCDKNRTPNF